MIRSLLYLTPRHGDAAAVVDYYRRAGVLERAAQQEGCVGAALQIPHTGSGPVLVTALWRDADAYEGWVANRSRSEDTRALGDLVDENLHSGVHGAIYEVVLAVGADDR